MPPWEDYPLGTWRRPLLRTGVRFELTRTLADLKRLVDTLTTFRPRLTEWFRLVYFLAPQYRAWYGIHHLGDWKDILF